MQRWIRRRWLLLLHCPCVQTYQEILKKMAPLGGNVPEYEAGMLTTVPVILIVACVHLRWLGGAMWSGAAADRRRHVLSTPVVPPSRGTSQESRTSLRWRNELNQGWAILTRTSYLEAMSDRILSRVKFRKNENSLFCDQLFTQIKYTLICQGHARITLLIINLWTLGDEWTVELHKKVRCF